MKWIVRLGHVLAGAAAFVVPQLWLFRHPPLRAAQEEWAKFEDPGWFLNSGSAVLFICIVLAFGAAILVSRLHGDEAEIRGVLARYILGAAVAMIVTFQTVGGSGNLGPIVPFFGVMMITVAAIAGGFVGAGIRYLTRRPA